MKNILRRAGPVLLLLTPFFPAPAAAQPQNATRSDAPATSRIRQEVRIRVTPDSIPVTILVESFKTQNEVIGLFKPVEITLQQVFSPTESMHRMTVQVRVKDKGHPVLEYFRNGARLHYRGQFYDHNVLPDIPGAHVKRLAYHAATAYEPAGGDYLEVIEHEPGQAPPEPLRYAFKSWRPPYCDVDGRIIRADDIASAGLAAGSFTEETLYGKEAVEKYGHSRYARGIMVFRTKHKK